MERLYLVCAAEDRIELYDKNFHSAGSIKLEGERPLGPKRVSYLNGCLYTANAYHGSVTKVDLKSGRQVTKKVCPYPTDLLALPEQGLVAVTCGETDKLLFLDETLQIADSVMAKSFPISLCYLPEQKRIAVSCLYHRKIRIFGADDHRLKRVLEVPGYPNAACPMKDSLLVAASDDGYLTQGKLYAFDADKLLLKESSVGKMPSAIYTDGSYIFVANTGNHSVEWIDLKTEEKKRIQVPEMPDHLVGFGEYVCVSCIIDQVLVVLDHRANRVHTIKTGQDPRGMCVV